MHSKIALLLPLSPTQPALECDMELVKKILYTITTPIDEDSTIPLQTAHTLKSYFNECNKTFIASERTRIFLLLNLYASLIISFIALAIIPVSAISITLMCVISFILFSVNTFTLLNPRNRPQQAIDWNKLEKSHTQYLEKLYNKAHSLNTSKQVPKLFSPNSTTLFTLQKVQSVETNTHINEMNENELNNPVNQTIRALKL